MAGPSSSTSNQLSPTNDDLSVVESRKLRELGTRRDITNTVTLVRAFNRARDPAERKAFRYWLSAYSHYLYNKYNAITDDCSQFLYALFDMSCQQIEDSIVLKRLFFSIRKRVVLEVECPPNLMKSLDYALNKIDASVVEGRWDILQSLIDDLLAKLSRASFTRTTYEALGASFFALYQTVILLQKGPHVLTASKCQEIKSRLKQIEATQEYYPIAYYARLIEIGINKLSKDSPLSFVVGAGHRAFYMTLGTLYFTQGITAAAHLNFDVAAFQSGFDNLRKAFPDFFDDWRSGYLGD